MDRGRILSRTRTAISKRNSRKLQKFIKAFGRNAHDLIPANYLEPMIPKEDQQRNVQGFEMAAHQDLDIDEYEEARVEDNDNHSDTTEYDDDIVNDNPQVDLNDPLSDVNDDNSMNDNDIDRASSDNVLITEDDVYHPYRNDTDDDSDGNDHDSNEIDDRAHEDNEITDQFFFRMPSTRWLERPLISKCHIPTKDHVLAAIAKSVRHHSSYEATLDDLRWTKISHAKNDIPTTKEGLWKLLGRNDSMISRHYYCHECQGYLGQASKTTQKISEQCPCKKCGPEQDETHLRYFLYLNLTSQIKQLLAIPNIARSLQYRFWRIKHQPDALEDIYDGREYEARSSPGEILENWFNFSLTINTDGCSIANSSQASVWPIYAELNELPPHLRKKHMFLVSVHADDKHPLMNNYLRPFVDEMRKLYSYGITWKSTSSTEVTSRFIVIANCVDLPARACVTNMVQFNGYNACLYCNIKGHSLGPGKMIFPFKDSYKRLRTSATLRADMNYVFDTGRVRNGVKGFSGLSALPSFDIPKGTVVEAMHAVFLGVAKQHMKLLLTTTGAPYYVGDPNSLNVIDSCLLSIKSPSRRSRKPRSIRTYSQWKASEWRNWLDYAPVCLHTVLDTRYVNHLACLSEAIHYLNGDSITPGELNRANYLLRTFVSCFEKYFGSYQMTSNVHQLTHLLDTIRGWGPIWAHSAFVFESWNKKIIDCITSPHARCEQIATRFLMRKFLYSSIYDDSISTEAKEFLKKQLKIVDTNDVQLQNKFVALGQSVLREPSEEERTALTEAGYHPTNLITFKKLLLNGVQYECEGKTTQKTDDSIICYCDRLFGTITEIVQFRDRNTMVNGIIVKKFNRIEFAFNTQFIYRMCPTNCLLFVHETLNVKPAIKISSNKHTYLIKLANNWETD